MRIDRSAVAAVCALALAAVPVLAEDLTIVYKTTGSGGAGTNQALQQIDDVAGHAGVPVLLNKSEQRFKRSPDFRPCRQTTDIHPVLALMEPKGGSNIALAGAGRIQKRLHLDGI